MKKLTALCLAACLAAALATPASALDCVGTSSISLALPHAAGLAHSAVPPFPTKSYDFAGTLYHFDAPKGPDYLDARCRPDSGRRRRPTGSKAVQTQKEEATDGDH